MSSSDGADAAKTAAAKGKKKPSDKPDDEEQEVDIHQKMIEIDNEIQRSHNVMDGSQPLDGKDPMDLLQVSIFELFIDLIGV